MNKLKHRSRFMSENFYKDSSDEEIAPPKLLSRSEKIEIPITPLDLDMWGEDTL